MRLAAWTAPFVAAVAVLTGVSAARAEDPPSLAVARETVAACRGEEHATKMRVTWPAMEDETPPDGAEVVLVRGYISYEVVRMVCRDANVEAGSVLAARSWFYNRKGEAFVASEFDVDRERFVLAWNAARRILAASDVRIEREPEHEMGGRVVTSSHASADWIRIRARPDDAPIHCADRPSQSYDWDDVRDWNGLRDEAIFETFEALVPKDQTVRRAVSAANWGAFAAAEIRRATVGLDVGRLGRDDEFLESCLRVLGEAGDETAETAVAAFDAVLAGLDASAYDVKSAREEVSLAATRLRIRHRWDREDAIRTLRDLPGGTWAREDHAKWLRRMFRTVDPEGWVAFLREESTRADARAEDVVAVAPDLKALPAAESAPILRALLLREDPYVRLEAAIALHDIDSTDGHARAAVVALALDRSIACEWRPDLTSRWSRNRALDAALAWGGLTAEALRAHYVAPEPEDPEFLAEGRRRLAGTAEALSDWEVRDAWLRLLDGPPGSRVLAAVRFLVEARDVASKERMLAALDRLDRCIAEDGPDAASVRADHVATWRQHVTRLGFAPDDAK